MDAEIFAHIDANIGSTPVKSFLVDLFRSPDTNRRLLCLCLLIDIKFGLLAETDVSRVIDDLISRAILVNYDNFVDSLPKLFRGKFVSRVRVARVISKPVYLSYVGSFSHRGLIIDAAKITTFGWSSGTGIVWVTPERELNDVIMRSASSPFPADEVCDHLGMARTPNLASTRSPREPYLEWIAITYSPHFPDDLYQSNSSNAFWKNPDLLFVSFRRLDGFGRTFNEVGVGVAREQVHERSFYFDSEFHAESVGKMSVYAPPRVNILTEAFNRLAL